MTCERKINTLREVEIIRRTWVGAMLRCCSLTKIKDRKPSASVQAAVGALYQFQKIL